MFHLQLNPKTFRKNVRDARERNSHVSWYSSIWWKLFVSLFKLLRGYPGILGWAIEVVKIISPLIILLPILFSALLKAYIQSGSDEILELYFPFCDMLSWWAGSVLWWWSWSLWNLFFFLLLIYPDTRSQRFFPFFFHLPADQASNLIVCDV